MDTYTKFVKDNMSPVKHGARIHPKLCQYVFGLSEEVGEVSQLFSKYLYYNRPIDIDDLKSELGDVIHYATAIGSIHNLSLQEILDYNISKLSNKGK